MASTAKRIGDILVEMGFITEDDLRTAMAKQKELGRERLGDVLIELGYVKPEDLVRALADQFGMDIVDLEDLDIDPGVIDMVPVDFVREHHLVPIFLEDETLTIAVSEPLDLEMLDNLRFLIDCKVECVLASKTDIDNALAKHYGATDSAIDSAITEFTESNIEFKNEELLAEDGEMDASDAPVIRLVTLIISEAVRSRASDIHVEPMADRLRIRYRIDGECYEVDSPPKRLQGAILARLKIMAKMNMAEKRKPQDGRIKLSVLGRQIDLRVNSLPAVHGESMVMRILDKESVMFGVQQLGFADDDYAIFNSLIKRPNGIMLVTGPTGSGKTTTLYAALNELNRSDRKLITAEDPVEYNITGINQAQVNRRAGMTFDKIIRAMLRQAPNIILVGEIRDGETAKIAIEAALTGHLVFSTLHTNDAPASITRLIDMGVPPFLVASSVQAVIAQRLIRRICPDCKHEIPPEVPLLKSAGLKDEAIAMNQYYAGQGCDNCKNIGFKGRRGIYEIMIMSSRIREMTFNLDTTDNIRRQAVQDGMHTLLDDGIRKVFEGVTTIGEVLSVAKKLD
ncbi:MAG: Flp pilus assembly complex ATPase component TadA [Planctomycetota bacterium]|jgi:type IV pilus assembly protein PilB|nr:Flp pilus assembly complex ATPase component TadA [Planctomycetota bacterium]